MGALKTHTWLFLSLSLSLCVCVCCVSAITGGMTNQHPGNEWFRRLVRSNRPLYKKCPKHTKLLVAKAIVQAVQQQTPPGRFLELADKKTQTWRQITYKRSVDKTSQALRGTWRVLLSS
jgi:hypothetical protein